MQTFAVEIVSLRFETAQVHLLVCEGEGELINLGLIIRPQTATTITLIRLHINIHTH